MDCYGHLFKSDNHKKAMDAIADDIFGLMRSEAPRIEPPLLRVTI